MVPRATRGALIAALAGLSPVAAADVTYLLQVRSISATTSSNNNTQAIAAPDFSPFVQSLNLSTPFATQGGGTSVNGAHVGIDCQLDPNAVRASGSVGGSGGMGEIGGVPELVTGEAVANVQTTFHLDAQTPFTLRASPRPSTRRGDRFKIKIKDETQHVVLFLLDDSSPPQTVEISGEFLAGDISLEYQVEMTVEGEEMSGDYAIELLMGPAACYANCDASTASPALNVNDFLCFMTRFASGDPLANCDLSTTAPVLNVNDFVCFQTKFAAGCSQP